jgi:nucleotide-binding universal stress UspA family protein
MGSHGKGLLEHTFVGSVTHQVLRRTHKPVTVIPLPKGEAADQPHD